MAFGGNNAEDEEEINKTTAISLAILSVFILLASVSCVITSAMLKGENSDIPDDMFIIWAGIPGMIVGVIGIIAAILKKKSPLAFFLALALFTMILFGVASVINGLAHWNGGWTYIAKKAKDCPTAQSVGCACVTPPTEFRDLKCGDLENIDSLLLAQSGLAAVTTFIILITCFLTSTLLCCGPWTFIPREQEQHYPPPKAPPQYSTYPGYGQH